MLEAFFQADVFREAMRFLRGDRFFAGGQFGMYMALDSVSIHDVDDGSDVIFADGFESQP